MLIIGAGGFAREILEIFHQKDDIENLAFYNDLNLNDEPLLFGRFPVLSNESQVRDFFKGKGNDFTIGIGKPHLREKMYGKFISLGGHFVSTISPRAILGSYEVQISEGCNILDNAIISNSTSIGRGCIAYYNTMITHDCKVGDFVELSPGATLLGGCTIGSYTHIGANATVLPRVAIGSNSIIGAGAIVNKDLPDNCIAVGVPARIIKKIS